MAVIELFDVRPNDNEAFPRRPDGTLVRRPKFETRMDDGRESDYCLITVLLSNDAGDDVVVTLGGEANSPEPRTFTYLADNAAVFFSVAEARRARPLLRGDPDALTLQLRR